MMKNRVKHTIIKNNLIDPEEKQHIVLGLSGGPDSLCLFHVLLELQEELNIHIHPVHVNHKFRPGAAEEDQDFVENLCENMGIRCTTFIYDCKALAEEEGISEEEAGRNARYEAFYLVANELMEQYGIGSDNIKIAVAQNANDQAETLLMRIMRGTGTEGLAGIEYQRNGAGGTKIIRPLLDIDRKDIEGYCADYELCPRRDETNLEAIYTRNKIRLELIPYMENNFNPNIQEALNRLSVIAKEDKEYMDGQVKVFIKSPLPIIEYIDQHPAIRKRILMRNLEKLGLEQGVTAVHLDLADRLIFNGKTGTSMDLPQGYRISISYENILFHKEDQRQETGINGDGVCLEEFVLRTRQPGDYILLNGVGGRKKIQDLFVDMKIAREMRNCVPLLCRGNQVVWIVGDDVSGLFTGVTRGRVSVDFDLEEEMKNRVFVELNKKI